MNESDTPKEFRVARNKLVHGALIAGLLLLVGLWLIFFADPSIAYAEVLGLINLALAGGILVVALRKAGDRQPHLVLDRDGIWFRDWGLDKVPWQQVRDVYTSGSRIQAFACIEIRDPQALLAGLPDERRRKLNSNRLVRPPRLLVPNGALDAPLQDILAALRAGLEEHRT